MKKRTKIIGGIATITMSIALIVLGDATGTIFSGNASSAKWTAEILCKSWEKQKKAVMPNSSPSTKERSYKIAISQARKEMREHEGAIQVVKKENTEVENYKEQVRKMSTKICNASESYVDGFIKALDRL